LKAEREYEHPHSFFYPDYCDYDNHTVGSGIAPDLLLAVIVKSSQTFPFCKKRNSLPVRNYALPWKRLCIH